MQKSFFNIEKIQKYRKCPALITHSLIFSLKLFETFTRGHVLRHVHGGHDRVERRGSGTSAKQARNVRSNSSTRQLGTSIGGAGPSWPKRICRSS